MSSAAVGTRGFTFQLLARAQVVPGGQHQPDRHAGDQAGSDRVRARGSHGDALDLARPCSISPA